MTNKNWKTKESIPDDFKTLHPEYSELILQILWNRGIKEKEEIISFLEGEKVSPDPFLFVDMEESVNKIIKHIKNGDQITIFGDYDADGVTSSVLLVDLFTLLNAKVDYYIPDRVSEGYGLNKPALEKILKNGTKLIVTVDTGIRNKELVDYIKLQNADIIITDHHQGPVDKNDYPDCLIINPALDREEKVYEKLAGVGVALRLMQALVSKSKLDDDLKVRLERTFFDLAAIGTVADCVPLKGENRDIVKRGLRVLSETKRQGLKDLIKVSNIKTPNNLDSWNIGFQLAPRINAAGRMDHANTAFALLLAKDKKRSEELADELNHNNQMRQKSTEMIFEGVLEQLKDNEEDFLLTAVYKYKDKEEHLPWNEGIIGLVAGRVTEKFYRPCFVITETEDGFKGSGRSIPEFNVAMALENAKEHLEKYGGHPLACGFSLKKDKLDAFLKSVKKQAKKELSGKDIRPTIKIDKLLDLKDIDIELVESLGVLRPFGQDNAQPIFLSESVQVVDKMEMGMEGQHLKLRLKNNTSSVLSSIGFSQSERYKDIIIGDTIDMVYSLDINEFNGRRDVQLKIIDIKKHV